MINGVPCTEPPVSGDDLCFRHGGKVNRLTRRTARLKAAQLVEPAIAQIAKLMVTAKSEAVRLRAAQVALDINGVGGYSSMKLDEIDARSVLMDRILAYRAGTGREIGARDDDDRDDDVTDAEVVEDTPAVTTTADPKRRELLDRLSAMRARDVHEAGEAD
ncbi:hypothetical protein ACFOYW_08325 [Gryllotalpicola reticulitermitis]|uniref:Terminase small subunit n=1 Tax=Gryllotalpicola reticulitermitis TaxID=1184153 RepID=A0ABV8Q5V2_9MICO